MEIKEVKLSFAVVWFIISLIILLTLAMPFVLPDDTVLGMAPECQRKAKYGKECPLCGMTRSFILISKAKFSEAFEVNRFSLYLYLIFVVNEIGMGFLLLNKARRRWSLILK